MKLVERSMAQLKKKKIESAKYTTKKMSVIYGRINTVIVEHIVKMDQNYFRMIIQMLFICWRRQRMLW